MYYEFDIEEQLKSIMLKCKLSDFDKASIALDELCDITDGKIYKRILASSDGHLFKKKRAFSFTMNTDGVSVSKSSKNSMWPVFLTINELPIHKRFGFENVILAGLTVGEEKPNIDLFLNPIVIQLQALEFGVNITIENITQDTKFFCIACCCDKPAKASLLNMMMFNSFYGCTKCLQRAVSYKTSELKIKSTEEASRNTGKQGEQREKNDGSTRLYTYSEDWKLNRTEENYKIDLDKVNANIKDKIKDPSVHGVKGPCILRNLKHFHPISSHCIDYMHTVLEGVIKNLFNYWFESQYSSGAFSMRKYMKEIDNRLSLIRPPKFIPSTPRSIYSYNFWSAHEYLSFFMYYALPVFLDIMLPDHYENLKKLILFLETILSPKINVNILKKVEPFLIEFVSELELLYSKSIMLSGVHELLHLTECTIDFGPLNSTNCFQYEEMNRKLLRIKHGNDLIGEEIFKIFSGIQVLSSYLNDTTNKKLVKYVKSRDLFKSSNKKNNFSSDEEIIIVKKPMQSQSNEYLNVFSHYIRNAVNEISISHQASYNQIPYSSCHYKQTKRSDSCFISKIDEKVGLIECFVYHNDTVYVIAKEIISLFSSFYSPSCPEIRSKMLYCYVSEQLFVEQLKNITKTAYVQSSNNNCFVSLFKSSHLFS